MSRPSLAASFWVGCMEISGPEPSRATAHPVSLSSTWIGALLAMFVRFLSVRRAVGLHPPFPVWSAPLGLQSLVAYQGTGRFRHPALSAATSDLPCSSNQVPFPRSQSFQGRAKGYVCACILGEYNSRLL